MKDSALPWGLLAKFGKLTCAEPVSLLDLSFGSCKTVACVQDVHICGALLFQGACEEGGAAHCHTVPAAG